jgi:4-hydroxy-2-oxoheptanedioate aldolase
MNVFLMEVPMKKNLLKEKLNKGNIAVGVTVQEATVQSTEILGLMGFDYCAIDCQHFPMSIESVVPIVMATELRGITPLIRLPQAVPEIVLPYLNTGVMGILVDDVNAADVIRRAVKSVKYPPQGERLAAPVRAADFGMRIPLEEYVRIANRETMVMGIVKSKEGIEHIGEILSVDGLDAVMLETADLAFSLGVPGQRDHPWVVDAVNETIAAAEKTGKAVGAHVRFGETPKQYVDMGFRIVSTSVPGLLVGAAMRFLENARG